MKNLVDFDISLAFKERNYKGIGNISEIRKENRKLLFRTEGHEVEIEEFANYAVKFTLDPTGLNYNLLVPHKNPNKSERINKYEIKYPNEGKKFQISLSNDEETILTPYAPGDQLGFINFGDELYEMFSVDENSGFTTISLRIPTQYGIYGLGESFTTLNKRGKTIYTFPTDNYCLSTNQVYKGIPFFLTNAGFGIVFPHYEPIKFDFGETMDGLILITIPAKSPSFYLIFGTPEEILSSFVGMFGEHPMPPQWSFGLWWSRWVGIGPMSLKEVQSYVKKFNQTEIPLDVVVIDPQWLKDYVAGVTQACSFDWDHDKFQTDDEVGNYLQKEGKKLALWINPYLDFKGTGYEKLKHCLLKKKDGKIALVSNQDQNPNKPDRGMVDFTREECTDIWVSLLVDLIKRSNANTVISDFGETVPLEATDQSGTQGFILRNKLGDLYQLAAFEGVRKATGEGMIWGRSGSLRSQNLPTKWGGDSNSTWEGMKTALRGALSASLSGSIFSAFDIGGFAGKPDKTLFLRWAAAETLFSYFKLQGTTEREPWAYDDDTVEKFRELAELRYSLMPYIVSEARKSVKSGIPLSRPLVLDFPYDNNVLNLDDEFMLGSSILVAPILNEDGRRMVYLPEGIWVYYYNGETFEGNKWILKEEGLNRVPFFIRKGSTLEFADGKGKDVKSYLMLPRVKKTF
jgi:alpha-D-xyloside xylohydrolase